MARAEYRTRLQKEVSIMIVLLLLLQWRSSHGCLEEERAALLQLQHSFNYPNGRSWLSRDMDIDCCKWHRVECNITTRRVNRLDLNDLRDESLGEWNFNASVFLPFQQLRYLDLSGNNIVCCLENEGFEGLQRLSNLEALYLDWNGLTDNILAMFQGFHSLKKLSLDYNNLAGSIYMKDLVKIPNLEELYLSGNNMKKFVSSKGNYESKHDFGNGNPIQRMIRKRSNYIKETSGSKVICNDIRSSSNLKSLYLEDNNFKGVLFPQDDLNKLEELFLDRSHVDENFLLSLGGFRSLRLLSMGSINYETLNNQSFLNSVANVTSLDESRKLRNLQKLCLNDNNLSGTLPSCLENLTLLQDLDLSYNYFTGNISASPLKSFTSIVNLDISNNQFQIPISLSPFLNHSKLKKLYAGMNEMYTESGGVDNNLTPKFQLQELALFSTYGDGGGSFPIFLQHQYDLRYLRLDGIQMRGAGFPSWLLDNNTNLESLSLGNCSLSGTIRLSIHPHPKLDYLGISSNQFYGHIPRKIGRYFPMLSYLSLGKNDFIGKIPNSLWNCSHLRLLDMNYNKLFGKIPEWIGNMSHLSIMDLSNNNLFGSLPSMFIPSQVEQVYLSHNRLEGPFPDVLPNSSVVILDLSHNYLTGGIPNSIKNLYQLMYVLLNHNNLEGEIPIYLWKMTKELKFVDLSHNRFDTLSLKNDTFETPPKDGGVTSYSGFLELEQKGNTYQYSILRIFGIDFIGLDLSSNNLLCSIPFEIGNKEGMKMLNLSRNNLIGFIPLSFSTMTSVESLDLSYNHLSGILPPQLVQLEFLEVFSVAYNNISGKTPARVRQFATFEESSYRGNPFLCGVPLPKNCTPTESSMTKKSSISDTDDCDGFIDTKIFLISFWVTFTIILLAIVSILYINPYWRQAWFYFIELMITSCYYFLVDHFPFLSKFGIAYLL